MNIFEAIRYLQDKPEGTKVVANDVVVTKYGIGMTFYPPLDIGFFVSSEGIDTFMAIEHADFQPVVDTSKLVNDAKVLVSDGFIRWQTRHLKQYHPNSELPYECYCDGTTSWTHMEENKASTFWKYCKLAEV